MQEQFGVDQENMYKLKVFKQNYKQNKHTGQNILNESNKNSVWLEDKHHNAKKIK
jgi:hypothetical protein